MFKKIMGKDKSITDLLEKLKLVTDFHLIEITDYREGDNCAIGLKRGNKLVYINSFNSNGKYDYDLELLDILNAQKLNVIKEGRDAYEDLLISEIKEFLGI